MCSLLGAGSVRGMGGVGRMGDWLLVLVCYRCILPLSYQKLISAELGRLLKVSQTERSDALLTDSVGSPDCLSL